MAENNQTGPKKDAPVGILIDFSPEQTKGSNVGVVNDCPRVNIHQPLTFFKNLEGSSPISKTQQSDNVSHQDATLQLKTHHGSSQNQNPQQPRQTAHPEVHPQPPYPKTENFGMPMPENSNVMQQVHHGESGMAQVHSATKDTGQNKSSAPSVPPLRQRQVVGTTAPPATLNLLAGMKQEPNGKKPMTASLTEHHPLRTENFEGKQLTRVNDSNMNIYNDPDYTKISGDLADRVEKAPQYSAVSFFWRGPSGGGTAPKQDSRYWRWDDNSYVRMPHSPLNKIRGGNGAAWDVITRQLLQLKMACERGNVSSSIDVVMASIVHSYFPAAPKISNFGMLNRRELEDVLLNTIPFIVDYALKLPGLLGSPLPNLKCGDNKTIFMSRKLCCSILANAFFCTFPESTCHANSKMPDFNFIRLYNDTHTDRCEVKKEKIKCLLNYFYQFHCMDEKYQDQIVSFERRCLKGKMDWGSSNKKLCDVGIDVKERIEDADGMLQCDFANKYIGGGVLNDGSVMEEIRFCISPELIVSRLFTEVMEDDEVVVITGSQIYSEYSGYSTSFKFSGPNRNIHSPRTDNLGRTFTQLVAIDALSFKKHEADKQYRTNNIDRELHKCFVAFHHGKYVTPVATGNWGCGAFNGNTEVKFLIQWMAASQQERGKLVYHTAGDHQQANDIKDMTNYLEKKKVDVGKLYKLVVKYKGDRPNASIFKFVKDNLGGSGFGLKREMSKH